MLSDAALDLGCTEEYLRDLNAVLQRPGITPIGAYCVGVVQCAASSINRLPDRELLDGASRCHTIKQALQLAEAWIARQNRATPKRPKKHERAGASPPQPVNSR